jgi:hypothetical protein
VASTGEMIVASGSELKLFKANLDSGKVDFANFSNYPIEPTDVIIIHISTDDLRLVTENLTRTESVEKKNFFWSAVLNSFDGERIRMPYHQALLSI